jgi:hypothetical protein
MTQWRNGQLNWTDIWQRKSKWLKKHMKKCSLHHSWASAYMPIPGLDSGGEIPELRLKFYCSWIWCVFFFPCCLDYLFVLLLWGFLFLFFFSFFSFYTTNFTITIFSSLLTSPSFSLLLLCENPLHSFLMTLCAPSHPLLTPACTLPSHSPPTCHQTIPPSYTLTTCWPTYYTKFTQPQPPTIPDTSTLHYNNRKNTQTHTRATKPSSPHTTSPSPTPLPTTPFSATITSSPNFYS